MFNGIDVSAYQGKIDFSKVANDGIEFAILRTITRSETMDKYFYKYYDACKENDIPVGVYFFPYAGTYEKSKAKAQKVIDALGGRYLALPVFLDLEEASLRNQDVTHVIEGAKEVIESAGYRFGIYCNLDWYKNVKGIKECIKKYNIPLWLARYPAYDNTYRGQYKPNVGEAIWQWTSYGNIDGISTRCDRNMMYENLIIKEGTPEEKPVEKPIVKDTIVETAKQYIGKVKYVFGANNVDGGKADCSSFVQTIYAKHGIKIGRDTNAQWQQGVPVGLGDIKEGDLIFFKDTYKSDNKDGVSHVGIYAGKDEMIHCSSGAKGVVLASLSSEYFMEHYLGVRRYVDTDSIIPCLKGYKGFSVTAGLKSYGYDSSFEYRTKLWSLIGKQSKYKGTALQNLTLLNVLKK